MPRDIDEATLHVVLRCVARSAQVLVRSLPKVTSFGPREQFLPRATLAPRDPIHDAVGFELFKYKRA